MSQEPGREVTGFGLLIRDRVARALVCIGVGDQRAVAEVVMGDRQGIHRFTVPAGGRRIEDESGPAGISRRGDIDTDRPVEAFAPDDETRLVSCPNRTAELGGECRREDSRFPDPT